MLRSTEYECDFVPEGREEGRGRGSTPYGGALPQHSAPLQLSLTA